jgi:16S rRNA (cytidine1402-2'-O)-methyltransferase
MANKGNLYLIPNSIADDTLDKIITPQLRAILPDIRYFLAENIRSARRYLASLKVYESVEPLTFSVLDKDTRYADLDSHMEPLREGNNMGVISESGCPGIADPGALAVLYAHKHGFRVIPLVGPSSIVLALMASGLNGQKFGFHGYLPIDAKKLGSSIRSFEKESKQKHQTQIFIETPYRNNTVLNALLKHLAPDTLLTIALDLTGPSESVRTRPVEKWRLEDITLPKEPAVFLFLA